MDFLLQINWRGAERRGEERRGRGGEKCSLRVKIRPPTKKTAEE